MGHMQKAEKSLDLESIMKYHNKEKDILMYIQLYKNVLSQSWDVSLSAQKIWNHASILRFGKPGSWYYFMFLFELQGGCRYTLVIK